MQNLPLVSVICISYNHAPYIEEALNSVLQQSYPNIQLVIADDCSTDTSKEVIENWIKKNPTVPFFPNSTNLGNTKTFNNTLKKVNGAYIIDLAADDVLQPNCIEEQIKTFQNTRFANLAVVYGNLELIDENNQFISHYYTDSDHPESGDIYKMVISKSTKICSVSSMIKKEILEKEGGYDENLSYEDLDLWVKISRKYDFEYIPKVLVKKRELNNSLGSYFYKRINPKTKKLHHSSYVILLKAYYLNKNKEEHKALLSRIKYQFMINIHSRNYPYIFKYIFFYIKVFFKSL
ncbi:glycosyltransferase [Flavobacterium sp. TP390]|uniref:Glycosyltransferase n=1 Tax=Flavobacterium profundi TaxID=1774945 RepID=A0A6I4IVC7_9FLAO|nr:glycosyltransferase family A protein [Flavobacterium profundi]MVO10821.1 glycosyltransferase [Flavobacterium profundi]